MEESKEEAAREKGGKKKTAIRMKRRSDKKMLKQDWTMREVETLTLSLSRFVFGKETTAYTVDGVDPETDALALRLNLLLDAGDYNGAENALFDALETGAPKALELAVDLYARLNELTDEKLKAGDYTREEVQSGLQEAMDRYGVVLP